MQSVLVDATRPSRPRLPANLLNDSQQLRASRRDSACCCAAPAASCGDSDLLPAVVPCLPAEGDLPVCNGEHTVWQFNFKGFKLSEDVYASDSIELLKQSGIDFAQVRGAGHRGACC